MSDTLTIAASNRLRVEELAESAMVFLLKSAQDLSHLPIAVLQNDELNDALAKIYVSAESQGESIPRSGVHKVRLRITLEADATQVKNEDERLWWSAIMGIVYDSDLETFLSTALNSLFVYPRSAVRIGSTSSRSSAEDRWVRAIFVDIAAIEQ